MKSSKVDPRMKTSDGLAPRELLNDIDTISNALYLNKTQSKNTVPNLHHRSKSVGKSYLDDLASKPNSTNDRSSSQKEKKSIWNWKGLMGFTRNRRFNCCFSLQVHSIEGLPSCFEDLNFCVHFKRRDEGMVTNPARVLEGVAEFGDRLNLTCSVYGSRSGPHHSAKYEAKHFLLYAALTNNPELDLGKHRVDLTRFLPLTLEELEDEKSSSNWSTSFKLSGIAKGAIMNVTFGYTVMGSNSTPPIPKRDISYVSNLKRNNLITEKSEIKGMIQRTGSLPSRSSTSSRSVEDLKDLHEVLPTSRSELGKSVETLYRKLDEGKLNLKADSGRELDSASSSLELELEFDSVSRNGDDMASGKHELEKSEPFSAKDEEEEAKKEVKLEEGSLNPKMEDSNSESVSSNVNDLESGKHELEKIEPFSINQEEEGAKKEVQSEELSIISKMGNSNVSKVDNSVEDTKLEPKIDECGSTSDDTESLMKDLESALHNVSISEIGEDSPVGDSEKLEKNNFTEIKSDYKMKRKAKSLCLDDITNSVADDFLNMLGIEHSPFGLSSESEPESPRERLLRQFEKDTLASGSSLFNFNIEEEFDNDEFELFQAELDLATGEDMRKPCVSMLEDLETETLMHEWGLNDNTFIDSPPGSGGLAGFGSSVRISPDEAQLPPLGEGVGSFVQTKNGGFLRSMNPENFRNSKNGGCLVMQVSSPVVVPAEMGSGIMEILERLASVGIEKLSMQANKLMPLDDVTGMTMRQVAWEAVPGLEASERQVKDFEFENNVPYAQKSGKSSKFGREIDSEYVSLEDLAPLAMDKMEALSIEGLRIQSGMSDDEAPSNITPQNFGEISALKSLEGAGGLQLLDIKERNNDDDDVDNLMSLSLTLDEWLRIDSGDIDDEDGISERTSKILAAHHASDSIRERSKGDKKRGKSSKKCGLLGNNFTVALLVQLRDPIRNYEPVGTPMLALIQVERVFVPPKPKFYITVSDLRNKAEEDEEMNSKPAKKEDINVVIEEPKEEEQEEVTQFKITEVHVAGLKTEPGKKNLWSSSVKQQSGSRWLVANGMGKGKKPTLKSKAFGKNALPATVTAQRGDTLWSISARVLGNGGKWKELAKLNPHIRNPNVILSNETIKLR